MISSDDKAQPEQPQTVTGTMGNPSTLDKMLAINRLSDELIRIVMAEEKTKQFIRVESDVRQSHRRDVHRILNDILGGGR